MLLTRPEAARELNLSVRTLDELIATGQLRVIRLGRRLVRIRPADLEKLIRGRTRARGRSEPRPTA
jgi:excisionase family DNA binding protein